MKKTETIAASLFERILAGEFEVGQRLPKEEDLAEDYDVARGTVRESRRILEDRGVVDVTHGVGGAAIAPVSAWNLFDGATLAALLDSSLARDLLKEAIECRLTLEPQVAALGAERATRRELQHLRERLAQVQEPAQGRSLERRRREAELGLHRAVLETAHNRFLVRALLPLEDEMARRARGTRPGLEHHERVIDAIAARDPEAARAAMRARVEAAVVALGRGR